MFACLRIGEHVDRSNSCASSRNTPKKVGWEVKRPAGKEEVEKSLRALFYIFSHAPWQFETVWLYTRKSAECIFTVRKKKNKARGNSRQQCPLRKEPLMTTLPAIFFIRYWCNPTNIQNFFFLRTDNHVFFYGIFTNVFQKFKKYI